METCFVGHYTLLLWNDQGTPRRRRDGMTGHKAGVTSRSVLTEQQK